MLQAAAQPYAGLNRPSPLWLVATRDPDSRGIVYVEAGVELDGMLAAAHVLLYADEAASQRVLSKRAPSESAYQTWLSSATTRSRRRGFRRQPCVPPAVPTSTLLRLSSV